MTTKPFKSLGIEIQVPVPATHEEFNENAKGDANVDACLREAINNVVYRSWLAVFRPVFLHGQDADPANNIPAIKGIEEETGIEREATKDKDGVVEKYTETEGDYFARVCAKLGQEPSSFKELADQVAAQIPFDASASERGPMQPKKTAKAYLDAADQIIAAGADKATAVAAALQKILTEAGNKGIVVEATRESLGKAISLNEARKRAEENKKLAGQYTAMVEA
jgi:hypothetical protein